MREGGERSVSRSNPSIKRPLYPRCGCNTVRIAEKGVCLFFYLALGKEGEERNNDVTLTRACTSTEWEWNLRVIAHVPMTTLLVLAIERTHAWPVRIGFTRRLCRAEDNLGIVGLLMSAMPDRAGIIVARRLCAQPAILSRLWRRACRLADAWRIPPIPRAHDRAQDGARSTLRKDRRIVRPNYRPAIGRFQSPLIFLDRDVCDRLWKIVFVRPDESQNLPCF